MAGRIDERLKELGIELPQPSKPGANYVPFVRTGALLFLTGSFPNGTESAVSLGNWAASVCAESHRPTQSGSGGGLDRVLRCVRVAGFINSVPEFIAQSQVLNGASDVFVEVFGVDVSALPYDVAVEVEAICEVQF